MVTNKKQLLFIFLSICSLSLYSMERPTAQDKIYDINSSFNSFIEAKIQELQNLDNSYKTIFLKPRIRSEIIQVADLTNDANYAEFLRLEQEISFLRQVQQDFNDEVTSSNVSLDRLILLYAQLNYATQYAYFMKDISDELIEEVKNIFKNYQ